MASFSVMAVIALVLGVMGYWGVSSTGHALTGIGETQLPSVADALVIKGAAETVQAVQRTLVIPGLDDEIRQHQYDRIAAVRDVYQKAWDEFESLEHAPEVARLWQEFGELWGEWRVVNDEFFKLCRERDAKGIPDPTLLRQQLERFRGDHYAAELKALHAIEEKKSFEGGDDHNACAFGKWLSSFATPNADITQLVNAMRGPHQDFHDAVREIKKLVAAGKTEEAITYFDEQMEPAARTVFEYFDKLRSEATSVEELALKAREQALGPCLIAQRAAVQKLDEIAATVREEAETEVVAGTGQANMVKSIALGAMALGVALSITLGLLITRNINTVLKRVSAQLQEGSSQVNDAALQVAQSSQQLAAGASEQASSLEETSSALEEMASQTRNNASNAQTANDLAAKARSNAESGDQTMKQLNAAMNAINESAGEIGKIIKVIEEIAFQTNLLALNAAVEAARAGEHGKGFAVVADEVRNLAMRAAEAARETTSLIEGSVSRAKEGTDVADSAAKALQSIATDVAQVADLLGGISSASEEQAQGVEQINGAVTQMDKVTQQSAAGAEQAASASEQLSAQAQTVQQIVGELLAMVGGAQSTSGSHDFSAPKSTPKSKPKSTPKPTPVTSNAPQPYTPDNDGLDDNDSFSNF